MSRVIGWFSCGIASAVACALTLQRYPDAIIVRIIIPGEHPDNDRFAANCASWYGTQILELQDPQKRSPWDVWQQRRYIAGPKGAPCTGELKKLVRYRFQRPDDTHIFGYTVDEVRRANRFAQTNSELRLWYPLIDAKLTKNDCRAIIQAKGIAIPVMYQLGFRNNNCIGCPMGGAGYWNLIRLHFPTTFERMVQLSRTLGVRIIKQDGKRVFLDELRPDTGRKGRPVESSRSAFCDDVWSTLVE